MYHGKPVIELKHNPVYIKCTYAQEQNEICMPVTIVNGKTFPLCFSAKLS